MVIQLRPDVAPQSVERIKTLTRQGFYNGLAFFRVIEGFMAQAGDPLNNGTGGSPLPDVPAEFNGGLHVRGAVGMARAQDPNSANSQFYIMFTPHLAMDRDYTVFGRVVSGMQFVDAIQRGQPPANPTRIVRASLGSDNVPEMSAEALRAAGGAAPAATAGTIAGLRPASPSGAANTTSVGPVMPEPGVPRQPEPPQDPYTVRCAPQYLGAVADVLAFHDRVVVTELNSVTDNPVFFGDEVVHGGNFYGQHVAFASDALATAVIKLAVAAERRIARITDEAQNRGLPPFLQARAPGLQSGFMGAQVTATALVAEMRTLGVPASIQSIPTNANNQDVVTLGTIAARRVADLLELLFDVLAIEALILTQGLELRSGDGRNFAPASRAFARAVRQHAPPLEEDRALAPEIAALSQALRSAPFGGESYASKKG